MITIIYKHKNTNTMNITPTKIIRELEKKHGWDNINGLLIKDILKIIDDELMKQKNITIKK